MQEMKFALLSQLLKGVIRVYFSGETGQPGKPHFGIMSPDG